MKQKSPPENMYVPSNPSLDSPTPSIYVLSLLVVPPDRT